ncbi:amicyanin [Labrys sp. KNU-23]|nr:amicyanin [Labrys sp. KNU-23]
MRHRPITRASRCSAGLAAAAGAMLLLSGGMARAATIAITVSDLAFEPAVAEATVGDTIEWRNVDFVGHTATDRSGQWDVALPAGKTASIGMTTPGVMSYFCRFHPQMTGIIRVKPKL